MEEIKYRPLSSKEERIGKLIVEAAFKVHSALGPGLLESIYEECFCHEIHKRKLTFRKQIQVPVIYEGIHFETAFRLDVLVEESVICELKAVEMLIPLHQAQLLSYLRLSQKRLGYLINFHTPLIKNGIRRIIL